MLVETFGGLGPALVEELRKGAEWRANKLTAPEYDETTWSAWSADVHGVHDAAPLGGGAVLGRAGGGRGARPVGGGQPTSGTLEGRRGHDPRGDPRG